MLFFLTKSLFCDPMLYDSANRVCQNDTSDCVSYACTDSLAGSVSCQVIASSGGCAAGESCCYLGLQLYCPDTTQYCEVTAQECVTRTENGLTWNTQGEVYCY